jgi:hypothetical protein
MRVARWEKSVYGRAALCTGGQRDCTQKISHVDVKTTSILGLYGTKTTYVYGE